MGEICFVHVRPLMGVEVLEDGHRLLVGMALARRRGRLSWFRHAGKCTMNCCSRATPLRRWVGLASMTSKPTKPSTRDGSIATHDFSRSPNPTESKNFFKMWVQL